jgi:uncharacterized circularly permuted ATP-grasp superfamily protein/uncharacterized alpha-E superfamily protein
MQFLAMKKAMVEDATQETRGLLADYRQRPGAFDELLAQDKSPRPHYAKLLQAMEDWGSAEFERRCGTCQRLVTEQGITYNDYRNPQGIEQPWQLDPVPLVLSPQEWSSLEAGLVQRATLLNRILADCYGAQQLIRTSWLSPALVFAQPDFLRPCHGIRQKGDTFLHFYAADLARSADGQWWVKSDRTQISTGAGYALANRLVTSRLLPEPFRENNIHRLAGFFREVRKSLIGLAPRRADRVRVVTLTPGPHNETYFEQAYLARYLGFMLVEGQDLTVRDNHVFLKTLSGLERVDVILRRVDDDFCDPLELRNDSILGVPGLVEALRSGNVAVANSLGTGLVQSPAYMAFLPGLCRHLLGEDLKLPSVATWWCGQQKARKYVLENLDKLCVHGAFRTQTVSSPQESSDEVAREQLKRSIEFDPDQFVGQERVEASTAPSWDGGRLTPRPIALRVFLVATQDGYRVMPGGLARTSDDSGGRFVSMLRGGSSKDTWVVSPTPVQEISLLQTTEQRVETRRTGNNLPSRIADNFFWLGRYLERADATSRLIRSVLQRFNSEGDGDAMALLAPLLGTLEARGQLSSNGGGAEPEDGPSFESELLGTIFDADRPTSLRRIADHLQRLAVLVRDRTSNDMWRVLTQINQRLVTPVASLMSAGGDVAGMLNQTLLGLAAFHGLARENMTRAQGWRFLDIGMRLERAHYLCTLLDATLRSAGADNPSVLEAVLEAADSSITYRSRYSLMTHLPGVFDLILLDDKNPRSVLFQINQLTKHFEHLPQQRQGRQAGALTLALRACAARLNEADAKELSGPRQNWARSRINVAIQETLRELPRICDTIAASYFEHSAISRTGSKS